VTSPLVIIPCGGKKAGHRTQARSLYRGAYFRAGLTAARRLTSPDRIRILSAMHGLLRLDELVAPYDLRMGQPGSVTAERVLRQAAEQGLVDEPHVVVLGGKAYRDVARAVWPHAEDPLAGTRSMGEQMAALARMGATT